MKVFAISAAVLCTGFGIEGRGKGSEDKQPDTPLTLVPSMAISGALIAQTPGRM
ncbi:hypothetical protein [Mesorhizobium sp. M0491]|uniref:hypothetical protein n=1 Tax=Mesorhizobium sp. M0491 TaxID=2956950 RepID=UPI00333DB3DA